MGQQDATTVTVVRPASPARPSDEPLPRPSEATADGPEVASPGSSGIPTDGRAARAARTRQAIVDGLLSLLREGDLQPTANRIAERAGISLRLIYHHFGDLESLFRAASVRQAEQMVAMVTPIDAGTALEDRIDAVVDQRARIHEWVTPVSRAARLQEPFSEELQRAREGFNRAGSLQLRRIFAAEVEGRPDDDAAELLAAVNLVSGWEAWDALRVGGCDPDQARAVVRRTLSALLGS